MELKMETASWGVSKAGVYALSAQERAAGTKEIGVIISRAGNWLTVELQGTGKHAGARFGYNLKEGRWSYNLKPPTDAIEFVAKATGLNLT